MEVKPGYKLTEVGVIPEDWEMKTLGEFISLRRGYDLTETHRHQGNVPVMGAAGQNGFHNIAIAKGPGIVLGRSGASFGQAHFCQVDYWPHNTALYVTDFRGNNPLFVYYFLRLMNFTRYNSGGAQPSLNRNFIYPIKIAVPNPIEQRAIADALSDVDALIGALDQLIAKKHGIKQATMQQLLTGKRRLPGFHGEWEVKRLGDVAILNRLNVFPASFPTQVFVHFSLPAFDAGKIPVIEAGAAIGSNKFRVPQRAVLVSKLNPRIPRVWAPDTFPPEAIASTEFLILTPKEGLSRRFLFVICSSSSFCEQMELGATGTTGSHQRTNPTGALNLTVQVPADVNEQTAIAEVLSDMNGEIDALEKRRDKTRALKQGMMQELLTGRTRLV